MTLSAQKIGKMDVVGLNIYQEVYVEYTIETYDIYGGTAAQEFHLQL